MECNPDKAQTPDEKIRRQNEDLLKTLKPGDLIKFDRDDFEHWAVYIGKEEGVQKVIHWWTGNCTGFRTRLALIAESFLQFFRIRKHARRGSACIRIAQFWEVAGISLAVNGNEEDREDEKTGSIDGSRVAEGAKAFKYRTERDKINGLFFSSEHFVKRCCYGLLGLAIFLHSSIFDGCKVAGVQMFQYGTGKEEICRLFNSSEHFAKWCRYGRLAQIKSVEEIAQLEDLSAFVRDTIVNDNSDIDKNKEDNTQLLAELKEGDLIKFSRTYYYHWAVYIGKHNEIGNAVIHWWSPADCATCTKSSITITSFWKVAKSDKAYKGNDKDDVNRNIDGLQVVRRALIRYSLVTEEGIIKEKYNFMFNNCRHFARWCRYGSDKYEKTQKSSSCRLEEDLNIEDPATRAAVLELQRDLYKSETTNLVLQEKIRQLITEIKKLYQDNFQRDLFMYLVAVLCAWSLWTGRK